MTLLLGLIALVLLEVACRSIFRKDLLFMVIEALVHLRAALICAGRSVVHAGCYFKQNFGFAVDDVRREVRMQA